MYRLLSLVLLALVCPGCGGEEPTVFWTEQEEMILTKNSDYPDGTWTLESAEPQDKVLSNGACLMTIRNALREHTFERNRGHSGLGCMIPPGTRADVTLLYFEGDPEPHYHRILWKQ